MATQFRVKRNTVSGIRPTTSDIASAELAINVADGKLFSTNGSIVFEIGANVSSLYIGNTTANTIIFGPNSTAYSATNYFLHANGSWVQVTSGGSGSPGGSNTHVQFNDSGSFGGTSGLTFDKTSNTLVIANTITTNNLIITGSVNANSSNGNAGQVLTSNGSGVYWSSVSGSAGVTISDTAPVSPSSGDFWWNSSDGNLYIYYSDGDSAQWVIVIASAGAIPEFIPAGSNTEIQFNNSGYFGSVPALTFSTLNNTLTVSNTINTNNIILQKALTANSTTGTDGQVLTSNGTGTYWNSPITTGKVIAMAMIFG